MQQFNHSFVDFVHHCKGEQLLIPDTPFQYFIFEQQRIVICYIPLKNYIDNCTPPDYFEHHQSPVNHTRLIHIWEDIWHTKTTLVQQRILALLGLTQKIHARQTEVIRITKESAHAFLNANHLQGATSAYYKYALLHKNNLVAVATFSKARTMFDGPTYYRSFELERFANLSGTTVVGGLGKLLHHFALNHHVKHLMTYADRDWSNGESYRKLGFIHQENQPANPFYIHRLSMERFFANRLTAQEQQSPDFIKIYNAGSLKFVLTHLLANK